MLPANSDICLKYCGFLGFDLCLPRDYILQMVAWSFFLCLEFSPFQSNVFLGRVFTSFAFFGSRQPLVMLFLREQCGNFLSIDGQRTDTNLDLSCGSCFFYLVVGCYSLQTLAQEYNFCHVAEKRPKRTCYSFQ